MTIKAEKVHYKIIRKLLSPRWLENMHISKEYIETEIRSASFKIHLTDMIQNNDFNCGGILSLCENMMNELAKEHKPEDWLSYIYQFTLEKSFPEATTIELNENLTAPCELYLRVLHIMCDIEKISESNSWKSKYALIFLTENEEKGLEYSEEYKRFIKAFKHDYIYEMMKLSEEVFGFNTLDHICGVHYLSLYIGRQLKNKNISVDLGRVSGAAAGHDVGKYGCKGSELKRVPHLHYYYTDIWFRKFNINYIRNIAINHSAWDLEFENLSLESLILIYSDFRVKNKTIDKKLKMHIFSLEESFKVILDKLENVDDAKERRYKRVYSKLKDFEDYLINLGINTDIHTANDEIINISKTPYSLMHSDEIVQNLKYLAIDHNINLMYKLRDEYSLDKILERARSEKDWKNLREYIRVFEEYSTYLTQKQKLQTIQFLYDNLVHHEDDIRRHCAELIGVLIALFDEVYRKEIPEHKDLEVSIKSSTELFDEYLNLLIYPKHKIIPNHRTLIGYSTSIVVNSLFKACRKSMMSTYRNIFLKYFKSKNTGNLETKLFLLSASKYIPLYNYDGNLEILFDYLITCLKKRNSILRLSSLKVTSLIFPDIPLESDFKLKLTEYFKSSLSRSKMPAENLLKLEISTSLNLSETSEIFQKHCQLDRKKVPDIFLSNLKTATNWVIKKIQIDLLVNYALDNPKENALHTCIHFCNLLKVSEIESVRYTAGLAILKIMPVLSFAERNEVAIELLRALEIEGQRFTEYIPRYLGQVLLWLKPKELNEVIDDLSFKIKISNANLKSLILKTIGIVISHYPEYTTRFEESRDSFDNRLVNLLGVLLNGLADYKLKAKQSAISVLGKSVFHSNNLSLKQKNNIFKLIAKKILTLITDSSQNDLLFLTHSAALNHIYRFISDFTFFIHDIKIDSPKKAAFFPGTFDPFSLSHKQIAKSIRDMGFEVYLAVDEFSWSKRTLPNILRRSILNMSISDELNMYIYPSKYPTNIANTEDLKKMRESFSPAEVYMVAGSDVIVNASSYKLPPSENSIHSFPHVIFRRGHNKKLIEACKNIKGDVKFLTLPSNFFNISSTQIRNCIDQNRNISNLIDPLAEQYIFENGFYQREPLDKLSISSLWLDVEIINFITDELINKLISMVPCNKESMFKALSDIKMKPSSRIILLKNTQKNNEVIGFSTFYWIRSNKLYNELKDEKLSGYIRQNASGRTIFINGMYVNNKNKYNNLEQILITETLSFLISRDYEYTVFRGVSKELSSPSLCELLELQGFKEIKTDDPETSAYVVSMSNPCILNLDIENIIKEPFRSNIKVNNIIKETRKKLQKALTELFPGELVLSFDSSVLQQSLIRMICDENNVPTEILNPRKLGSAMCVPYGDILDRYVVPNTVTKSLHTEKLFSPNMNNFKIGEFPYYLNLEDQIRMIHSFNKPVILVDNLLHKGYRMQALDPILKKTDINIQNILVGILSGRGKDLMDKQNRKVKSAYFIPRLKLWFNESCMYPFIGGDALWRGKVPERNLLPSINLIIPYTYPMFITNTSNKNIYSLSKVCLNNTVEILSMLENEFHELNARNLTLSSMGQVFTAPRVPDHGKGLAYDLNRSPSYYLKNDIELLTRLEKMVKEGI